MSDLLRMDFINSLGQIYTHDKWPVYDMDVETGLFRIDVCGMLDVRHIGSAFRFYDDAGKEYPVEMFYSDYPEAYQ